MPVQDKAEKGLAELYQERGIPADLAWQVAKALTDKVEDPANAHAKEKATVETEEFTNPWHAALASILSFSAGGAMPLAAAAAVADPALRGVAIAGVTLLTLVRSMPVLSQRGVWQRPGNPQVAP